MIRATPGHRVQQAQKGIKVFLGQKEKMVLTALLVRKAHRGLKALKVL